MARLGSNWRHKVKENVESRVIENCQWYCQQPNREYKKRESLGIKKKKNRAKFWLGLIWVTHRISRWILTGNQKCLAT